MDTAVALNSLPFANNNDVDKLSNILEPSSSLSVINATAKDEAMSMDGTSRDGIARGYDNANATGSDQQPQQQQQHLNDTDFANKTTNGNNSSSSSTSTLLSNGSIIIPEFLAIAASEHEQQQRRELHQQHESQRQQMKEQLEYFQVIKQQQQELQNQNENQSVTSQAIQQLLEENNSLISTFYEQIRKTKPLTQSMNWSLLLEQIKQNLKTISHLMANNNSNSSNSNNASSNTSSNNNANGKEKQLQHQPSSTSSSSSSTSSSSLSLSMNQNFDEMQQAVFSSQSLLSMHLQQDQNFSPNLKPVDPSNLQQSNGSTLHNLGPHLKTNPHSTAAVIAAAATLVYSRYNSGAASLSSSVIQSIHVTPSTSPSWKLFDPDENDLSFPLPIESTKVTTPTSTSTPPESNKNKPPGKRLPHPIAKSALVPNAPNISSPINSSSKEGRSETAPLTGNGESNNSANKKRSKDRKDGTKMNSEMPDIFERVDTDDDNDGLFESEEEIIVKKKPKRQKTFIPIPSNPQTASVTTTASSSLSSAAIVAPTSAPTPTTSSVNALTSPKETEVKKPKKSGPSARDEQVPAQEVLAEIEGLPKEFVDAAKQFSKSEARHWLSIKPHVARAGKRSDSLPDPDKWRAWVEITADLPLNNGGPIRRVLEVAVFCAEKCSSDPNILKVLNKALGPSVYKANAAGGCRRMALDMLQTFPESTSSASSKVAKKTKSPQSQPSSKDTVGIESASSNSPASTPNMIPINSSIVPETNNQSTE